MVDQPTVVNAGDAVFLELRGPPLPAWRTTLLALGTGAVAVAGVGVALELGGVGLLLSSIAFAGFALLEPAVYALEREHRILLRLDPEGFQARWKRRGEVERHVELPWGDVRAVRLTEGAVLLETIEGSVAVPAHEHGEQAAAWLLQRIETLRGLDLAHAG